jgi:hypothetical protein
MRPVRLPIEIVRDLLGIVRILYALHRRQGNHGSARELQRAGRQLRRALELAIRKGDAAAHVAAWRLANDAISTMTAYNGFANGTRPGSQSQASTFAFNSWGLYERTGRARAGWGGSVGHKPKVYTKPWYTA